MTNVQINLKDIEKEALKFNDLEEVKKAIRSVQSVKSRLQKQKGRSDYESEFSKVVLKEQLLKEVRSYMEPKKVTVTTMSPEQISVLTFDETMKAIKSIQSKKSNEQYNDDQTEYNKAVQIEQWLLEHKKLVKPVDETVVKKSEINDLIDQVENMDEKISKTWILEQLRKLV
jgi:hypothetical protein